MTCSTVCVWHADNGLSLRHSSSGQFNEEPNFLLLTCERHHTFIYFGDNMFEGRELCSTVGTQGARANWISDLTVGWRSCNQLVRWGGGAVCVLEGAFVRRDRDVTNENTNPCCVGEATRSGQARTAAAPAAPVARCGCQPPLRWAKATADVATVRAL